ncbi:MAG: arginine--tRNA ligase, partial [Polyangiales bacterium]
PKGVIPKKVKKNKAPYIVRKKDGAFLYATTDIATVFYRKEKFSADRSVYVVDQRKSLHFQQLVAVSALLGVEMGFDHIGFGTILGKDGKPLGTRTGGTLRLKDLLDEAEEQALKKINELREAGRLRIADEDVAEATHVIGVGAVKYADLMQNRSTDYKFDFDKMIAFSGNAGPYLQYQYARCRSIFAKGEVDFDGFASDTIAIAHPKERALAFELARFGDVVHRAAKERLPHYISDHLFAIAQAFSGFYTDCPVLGDDAAMQASRLSLTKLTALQLRKGLDLMGIGVLERM